MILMTAVNRVRCFCSSVAVVCSARVLQRSGWKTRLSSPLAGEMEDFHTRPWILESAPRTDSGVVCGRGLIAFRSKDSFQTVD